MKITTKILSAVLALIMMITVIPTVVLAKNKDVGETGEDYVVASIEGLSIGQGYYVEPTLYTYDEVINLYKEATGVDIDASSITAAHVTVAQLYDNGIEYDYTGTIEEGTFYLSRLKGVDKGVIDIPEVISENGNCVSNDSNDGNDDEWLGEFDYSGMSGWMVTVDNYMINVGAAAWYLNADNSASPVSDYDGTHIVRWQFTVDGYGADLGVDTGWGLEPYFEAADKGNLIKLYAEINRFAPDMFISNSEAKDAALEVLTHLDATQGEVNSAVTDLKAAYGEYSQGGGETITYTEALNNTFAYMMTTVPEANFGTNGGEWTVLSLARGGYLELTDEYFAKYYNNIEKYVEENIIVQEDGVSGIFHKVKATENERLIIALASIGRDATNVAGYDLVEPLSDAKYCAKQGVNGSIFGLIALDTFGYEVSVSNIREVMTQNILDKELEGGGWAFSGKAADPDMTGMAIQALASQYNKNDDVTAAIDRALVVISNLQNDEGGFSSWGTVNSESCAQILTALCSLGINPTTDTRFIKNGNTLIDAILSFYVSETGGFRHISGDTAANAMATDQATYALVAYDRVVKGKTVLYDMSDVKDTYNHDGFLNTEAILTMPTLIEASKGTTFNGTVSISNFDTTKEYKLIDFILTLPDGVKVSDVTATERLAGGTVYFEQSEDENKLRVVYTDINTNKSINLFGSTYPAELFTISFELTKTFDVTEVNYLDFAITGMSFKLGSDSSDVNAQHIINTASATATVEMQEGINVFAYELYHGDGIDLIPQDKKAIAVLVTKVDENTCLEFNGVEFKYNAQLTEATGVTTYAAIVSADVSLEELNKVENYTIGTDTAPTSFTFGDTNNDGVINAQDALNTLNAWLRKSDAPTDNDILTMNVNGDSRINTFDTLGIVDYFVNGAAFKVVLYGNDMTA